MKTCSSCSAGNPDDALFCAGCGSSMSSTATTTTKCSKCSLPIKAGDLFCKQCGTPISGATSAGTASPKLQSLKSKFSSLDRSNSGSSLSARSASPSGSHVQRDGPLSARTVRSNTGDDSKLTHSLTSAKETAAETGKKLGRFFKTAGEKIKEKSSSSSATSSPSAPSVKSVTKSFNSPATSSNTSGSGGGLLKGRSKNNVNSAVDQREKDAKAHELAGELCISENEAKLLLKSTGYSKIRARQAFKDQQEKREREKEQAEQKRKEREKQELLKQRERERIEKEKAQEKAKKEQQVAEFAKTKKIDESKAKYYLKKNNYDVGKASAAFNKDEEKGIENEKKRKERDAEIERSKQEKEKEKWVIEKFSKDYSCSEKESKQILKECDYQLIKAKQLWQEKEKEREEREQEKEKLRLEKEKEKERKKEEKRKEKELKRKEQELIFAEQEKEKEQRRKEKELQKREKEKEQKRKKGSSKSVFGAPLDQVVVLVDDKGQRQLPGWLSYCFQFVEQEDHVTMEGLYRVSGSLPTIQTCQQQIENGGGSSSTDNGNGDVQQQQQQPLQFDGPKDVHTATGLIKLFLRSLPEPLCPFALFPLFAACADLEQSGAVDQDKMTTALLLATRQLPASNRLLFARLISHLRTVSGRAAVNKMAASNLGIVFGPVLFYGEQQPMARASVSFNDARTGAKIVELLIQYDDVFSASAQVAPSVVNVADLVPISSSSSSAPNYSTSTSSSTTTTTTTSSSSSSSNPLSSSSKVCEKCGRPADKGAHVTLASGQRKFYCKPCTLVGLSKSPPRLDATATPTSSPTPASGEYGRLPDVAQMENYLIQPESSQEYAKIQVSDKNILNYGSTSISALLPAAASSSTSSSALPANSSNYGSTTTAATNASSDLKKALLEVAGNQPSSTLAKWMGALKDADMNSVNDLMSLDNVTWDELLATLPFSLRSCLRKLKANQ